jgi:hypothetical protein
MTYYNANMILVFSVLGILIIFFHYFSTLQTEDHFAFGITIPNFSIDTVGDWGCTADTLNTVKKIEQLNPNLVLALGDLSYATTGDCWLNDTKSIESKLKILFGNHEQDEGNPSSLMSQYLTHFHLTQTYYSFEYENVHFTIMNSEIDYTYGSPQYLFVKDDLLNASKNPHIKWIIVAFHTPMYTSPSRHPPAILFRIIYHPLFDKYGVDLVLQAHNHNYQRSYPLIYNYSNPRNPAIGVASNNTYLDPPGQVYLVVGTGGHPLYDLLGRLPYMAAQYRGFGLLSIDLLNNGTKLDGKFYDKQGVVIDKFTLMKR